MSVSASLAFVQNLDMLHGVDALSPERDVLSTLLINKQPPWRAVTSRRIAGCSRLFRGAGAGFAAMLGLAAGREEEPTAATIDSQTLRSTPERAAAPVMTAPSEARLEGPHGVDTLGHLLALHVTPADIGDRQAVTQLAADIQDATGNSVELPHVDQNHTGEAAAEAAAAEGITPHVVQSPEAKRGFVLLPRRWVVERSFA